MEMASAKKIREGLYSITWHTYSEGAASPCASYWGPVFSGNVRIENLSEMVESCKLEYRVDQEALAYDGQQEVTTLQMQAVFSEDKSPSLPSGLDEVVVLATYKGVQQKMDLNKIDKKLNLWITSFQFDQEDSTNQTGSFSFDILVDLYPGCVTIFKKGTQNVFNNMVNLWENKTLADVTFKCQGISIPAHTNILSCSSPVLATLLQSDFQEKRERIVEITDIKPKVFENFLRYLYTGDAFVTGENIADEDVEDLLVAAEKYLVESLKEECAVRLSKKVKTGNALRYLVLAHLNNSPTLHTSTLNFIAENANKTTVRSRKTDWMQMIKNYPVLAFQVIERLVIDKNRLPYKIVFKKKTSNNNGSCYNVSDSD